MSERVRYHCPGCGSELETAEGTVSNLCSFCGLVSLLGRPGRLVKRRYAPACDAQEALVIAERQVKKDGLPLLSTSKVELHYAPFYRFRALALDCLSQVRASCSNWPAAAEPRTYELRARLLDLTSPGCSNQPFDLSNLGVRPQAVTAWAFKEEDLKHAQFVWPVDLTPAEAEKAALRMNGANMALAHGGKAHEFSEVVGEHQTLIYFPVYQVTGRTSHPAIDLVIAIDGVSRRVLWLKKESWTVPWMHEAVNTEAHWTPQPHRCPVCGANLPASERSLFYICTNCSRAWLLEREGFGPVESTFVGEGEGDLYPFWRARLDFGKSPGYYSVGSFSKLLTADIPLLDKRKRELPFHVYVPAFAGADADGQVELATRATRTQPVVVPSRPIRRVSAEMSLTASEGLEFARFVWDWLRMSYTHLRSEDFAWKSGRTGSAQLVWLPLASERITRSVSRAGREISRAF